MRIGIIGTGSMGKNHLRVINQISQFSLTCANDLNKKTLNQACQPYNLSKCENLEQMIDLVDAVVVSTPTESHFAISKFFLDNNKHVMVEKPIAQTLEEVDDLIQIANSNHLVLAVDHLERFNPSVEYVNKFVSEPRFIEIQRLGPFSPRSLDIDVILDLMIHDLDILLQWDKSDVKEIRAIGIPIISDKIDIANVRLTFASGLVANVTASRVSQKKTRKLRIFQRNQYFSVDYKKRKVKRYHLTGKEIVETIPKIKNDEPLYNLWSNFYKTFTTKKNYNVSAEEARKSLLLALKISEEIKRNLES